MDKMFKLCLGLLFLVIMGTSNYCHATVLTGLIDDLPETYTPFYWGDGINDLYTWWSKASVTNDDGWIYPSEYAPSSNVDIHIVRGLTDPTTISDATVFPYLDHVPGGSAYYDLKAKEGDTVFFRGTNGYYGAWRIDDFHTPLGVEPVSRSLYLDGQWYFQDDGSGNFTSPVPEPATLLLLGTGLLGLAGLKKKKRSA